MDELRGAVRRALKKRDLFLRDDFAKDELAHRILELEKDLKETTAHLRETQLKYKDMLVNCNDMMVVVQDGHVVFANPSTSELTGFTLEEILGAPFTRMFVPEDCHIAEETGEQELQDEKIPPTYTLRLLRKESTSLWVEINAMKSTWKGRPAAINTIRDVSAHKRVQEILRIRDIAIASFIDGFAFAGLEGNLTYTNDSFIEIWRCDNEKEVMGKPIRGFWQKDRVLSDAMNLLSEKVN